MATTQKIAIEYTEKEMRRELKCFTKKKKNNKTTKHKTVMQTTRDKESIKHIEKKSKGTQLSLYKYLF